MKHFNFIATAPIRPPAATRPRDYVRVLAKFRPGLNYCCLFWRCRLRSDEISNLPAAEQSRFNSITNVKKTRQLWISLNQRQERKDFKQTQTNAADVFSVNRTIWTNRRCLTLWTSQSGFEIAALMRLFHLQLNS